MPVARCIKSSTRRSVVRSAASTRCEDEATLAMASSNVLEGVANELEKLRERRSACASRLAELLLGDLLNCLLAPLLKELPLRKLPLRPKPVLLMRRFKSSSSLIRRLEDMFSVRCAQVHQTRDDANRSAVPGACRSL